MARSCAALVIRRATDEDLAGILALAADALGWREGEPHAALFGWKHRENPFGASPMWVAEDDEGLAGFRTFLRWRFTDETGRTYPAVRAVDTATHPRAQGQGIFRRLTLHALEELSQEGVGFVFNTPNDQSRPGYLKMGWIEVGCVPVGVRVATPMALARMVRARVPAEKWSQPDAPGERASAVLADEAAVARLLERVADGPGLRTDRSPAFLAWRYRFEQLHYRVWFAGHSVEDGFCVYRLRRRGPALEATVAEVLVPAEGDVRPGRLLGELQRATGADYAIATTTGAAGRSGLVPLPRQGPLLVHRTVASTSPPRPLREWRLVLGDLELF